MDSLYTTYSYIASYSYYNIDAHMQAQSINSPGNEGFKGSLAIGTFSSVVCLSVGMGQYSILSLIGNIQGRQYWYCQK